MSPSPTLSCARSFSRSYSCSLCVCMVYLELFATGLVRQFKANNTIVVAPQKLDLHPHAQTHRGTRTRAHHHRVRRNSHILSCVYTCACAFVFKSFMRGCMHVWRDQLGASGQGIVFQIGDQLSHHVAAYCLPGVVQVLVQVPRAGARNEQQQ